MIKLYAFYVVEPLNICYFKQGLKSLGEKNHWISLDIRGWTHISNIYLWNIVWSSIMRCVLYSLKLGTCPHTSKININKPRIWPVLTPEDVLSSIQFKPLRFCFMLYVVVLFKLARSWNMRTWLCQHMSRQPKNCSDSHYTDVKFQAYLREYRHLTDSQCSCIGLEKRQHANKACEGPPGGRSDTSLYSRGTLWQLWYIYLLTWTEIIFFHLCSCLTEDQ